MPRFIRQWERCVTLDLAEVLVNWETAEAETPARLIRGRDGHEFLQLRIDAGLMQLNLNGRPDGERYRGSAMALVHIEHELRLGGDEVSSSDWQELVRELNQLNYRRLAFATMSETALASQQPFVAERMLRGAIRDIDACLQCIRLIEERPGEQLTVDDESLPPTLVFQRARLLAQLRVIQERYEDAIEVVEAGLARLIQTINEREPEATADQDPGVIHLRQVQLRLRSEYQVPKTLREKLESAVDAEDFPLAAELRNQLRAQPPAEEHGEFGPATIV